MQTKLQEYLDMTRKGFISNLKSKRDRRLLTNLIAEPPQQAHSAEQIILPLTVTATNVWEPDNKNKNNHNERQQQIHGDVVDGSMIHKTPKLAGRSINTALERVSPKNPLTRNSRIFGMANDNHH